MSDELVPKEEADPKTLRYFIERRNGKKRNYIFDYSESRKCPHPELTATAVGGTWYRCKQCNYVFDIVAAYQQPIHHLVTGAMLTALHFAKEFGADALGEVLRRPMGQYDGSPHKPVLPEGMTFLDVLGVLEGIDVNSEDGGKAQLKALLADVWEAPSQKPALGGEGENGSPELTSGDRRQG